jgi:hypothetical protein
MRRARAKGRAIAYGRGIVYLKQSREGIRLYNCVAQKWQPRRGEIIEPTASAVGKRKYEIKPCKGDIRPLRVNPRDIEGQRHNVAPQSGACEIPMPTHR